MSWGKRRKHVNTLLPSLQVYERDHQNADIRQLDRKGPLAVAYDIVSFYSRGSWGRRSKVKWFYNYSEINYEQGKVKSNEISGLIKKLNLCISKFKNEQ